LISALRRYVLATVVASAGDLSVREHAWEVAMRERVGDLSVRERAGNLAMRVRVRASRDA
jgi:hypothetical protein